MVNTLDILELVAYPVYVLASTALSFIALFNQKRIKKHYKIDVTISFMVLYVSNFLICYFNFEILNIYFRVALPLITLFIIIYLSNKVQIIGLTGGIACGKTAASDYMKNNLRLQVIDCDLLARRVVEIGRPAYKQLIQKYGDSILHPNRELNRAALGKLVFSDKKIRSDVTRLTGKYIFLEIIKEVYRIAFKCKENLMVLDAPILYETKYLEYFCFPIMVVYVSQEAIQIERLMARDKITQEEAEQKIRAQMPLAKKIELADILICNDGKKEDIASAINKKIPELVL